MTLTLQIQKEVTKNERNAAIKRLEREGWSVNVESEEDGDFLANEVVDFSHD